MKLTERRDDEIYTGFSEARGSQEIWTYLLICAPPPQKPEHLTEEMYALDSSKEQLLKEGEVRVEGWLSPAPTCPSLLTAFSL